MSTPSPDLLLPLQIFWWSSPEINSDCAVVRTYLNHKSLKSKIILISIIQSVGTNKFCHFGKIALLAKYGPYSISFSHARIMYETDLWNTIAQDAPTKNNLWMFNTRIKSIKMYKLYVSYNVIFTATMLRGHASPEHSML